MGHMFSKKGKPTHLLEACADALVDRVDELSHEERHVLRVALEVINKHTDKSTSALQTLKQQVNNSFK
jgi:hypothetical protein